MTVKSWCWLMVMSLLAGCAPMSVQGIRATGQKQSFTVSNNYQASYRTLVDEMRRCMQTGMITATVIVQGDLFTDIRKAVITPTLHGGLGAMPLFVVDLIGLDDGSTRIDVITKGDGTNDAKLLREFFGGAPICARD